MMIKWSRARSITLLELRACQRYLARTRCLSFAGASAWCLSILPALCLLLSRRSFDVESHSTSLHCFFLCAIFFIHTHQLFLATWMAESKAFSFIIPWTFFVVTFSRLPFVWLVLSCTVLCVLTITLESISSQKLRFSGQNIGQLVPQYLDYMYFFHVGGWMTSLMTCRSCEGACRVSVTIAFHCS